MLPAEFSEDKLVDINEERGCDENDDVSEEVMLAINFTLKELSEMFHNIEAQRIKIWKVIQF